LKLRISDRALFVGSTTVALGVRVLSTMALARFLSKEDYGRYQMVISTAGLVSAFGDFGVYRFVTSRQDLPAEETLDAAVRITLYVFGAYAVVALLSGLFYWRFFEDSRLIWAGLFNALTFAALGYYNLQSAALARELRFARMAGAEAATIVFTALAGIALAAGGAGIFALALPPFAAQLAAVLMLRGHAGIRRPRRGHNPVMKALVGFGWQNAAYDFLTMLQWNLYYLTVGSVNAPGVTGRDERAAALGLFGRAVNICSLFGHNLTQAVDRVIYPLLCKAPDDPPRFSGLFIRGSAILIAVAGVGGVALPAVGEDLVIVAMGPAWLPVVPAMVVLSFGLWFIGFLRLGVMAAMIAGKPLIAAAFCLIQVALIAPSGWVYHRYGLPAFCGVIVLTQAVVHTAFLAYTMRRYAIPATALLRRLIPLVTVLALAGLAMFAVRERMLTWDSEFGRFLPAVGRLSVAGLAGLLVGAAGMTLLDRTTLRELLNLVSRPARR
jgi:O-antigen/teichoic acid export membrane protein